MCVTAVLAAVAVVAAAGGMMAKIQQANGMKANASYQRDVQNKQAQEARDTARIQALEQENARTSEFERARSSAMAAIGASGLGDHISFFQGIDNEAQSAYLRDVRNVRLNLVQQQSTIADQVQVNNFSARIAKSNAGAMKLGAVAEFAQSAMSAASFYKSNASPKG